MATPRSRSGKPLKRSKALIRSASAGRKRSGAKPGGNSGSRQSSVGKHAPRSFLLPALTVLILTAVVLAGLLHWGTTSPKMTPEQQPVKQAHTSPSAPKEHSARQKETGPADRESRPTVQTPETKSHSSQGRPTEKPKAEPPAAPPAAVSSPARNSAQTSPAPNSPAQSVVPAFPKPMGEARTAPPREIPREQPKDPAREQPREPLPVQVAERIAPQPAHSGSVRKPLTPTLSPEGRGRFPDKFLEPIPSRGIPAQDAQEPKAQRDAPVERGPALVMNIPAKLPEAPSPPVQAPTAPARPDTRSSASSARVAIIIDDFGQDLKMAEKFLSLPIPVTFSILPFQKHSRKTAELAHARKREVILHIPMEPQGYPQANPGRGALLLSMSGEEVLKNLQTAVDATPYIQGANNHMGSRFTENPEMMRIVLAELQRRKLYFLDSFTTPRSTGTALAGEMNLPHAQRDIFLDHDVTEGAIRSQIDQLIERARLEGIAIAIGHPHEVTYRVLLHSLERIRQEGIEVVPLGSLAPR